MSIDPGAYEIQNVMHRSFAAQVESGVVASALSRSASMARGQTNLGRKWSISRLDNDKYTIRNIETNHYAAFPNFPSFEENVITTRNLQQWDIKETGFKGRYVIYTTAADIDLFWGLPNGRLDTPISLRDKPNTPSNQWELRTVDLWTVVGELRTSLADLRLQNVKRGDVHMKFGDVHMNLGDVHPNLKDEHTTLIDAHEKLWEEYKMLQDDYMKLSHDYAKLMDERSTLRSTVARPNAQHLQAEAELNEY